MRYFVFLSIILSLFQCVNAELPDEPTITELVTDSDFILLGVFVRTNKDVVYCDKQPYKLLNFKIKSIYKGVIGGDDIDVLIPTQEIDFLKPVVHCRIIPEYKIDNEYVLFLNKNKSEWYIRRDNIWQEKVYTQSLENKIVQELKNQYVSGGGNISSVVAFSVLTLFGIIIGYTFVHKI